MEVRCTGCNKLFRVSDDKIVGSGIKFSCTRCNETVKITREDFEQYKLAKETELLIASVAPKTSKTAAPPAPAVPETAPTPSAFSSAADDSSVFDLSDPATASAALSMQFAVEQEGEIPGLFDETAKPEPQAAAAKPPQKPAAVQEPPLSKPEPVAAAAAAVRAEKPMPAAVAKAGVSRPEPGPTAPLHPAPASRPPAPAVPKSEPKPEIKAAKAKPQSASSPIPVPGADAPLSELLQKETSSAPPVFDAAASRGSGFAKKAVLAAVVLLVVGGVVFGLKSYFGTETEQAPQTDVRTTAPDGLQILNPSAGFDSAKGDLVITGTVQNTTDKPKPAWLITVEVFDAQNAVIAKARLLSGKQLYTKHDLEILAKRGANIQELIMKNLEQGTTIPPKGSVNFEIRILDAPAGIASFNPVLQPFDPIQLFKELAEEQK